MYMPDAYKTSEIKVENNRGWQCVSLVSVAVCSHIHRIHTQW